METITAAQRITTDGERVEVRSGQVDNLTLYHIREAYRDGLLIREPAGPGWGSHNAILSPDESQLGGDELWNGEFLVTFEEGE